MGRSTSDERFVAVCIGQKRLYRIGNADIVQYSDDEVDRPLRIGQWVMVYAELSEITKITEIRDYVPTEVRDGSLYLDVKIEFRRSPENNALNLARCSELSEDILVPETLDTSAFDVDEEYGMIITPATQSEMNAYNCETGGETRWKLFLEQEEVFEEVQRPPKKCTINSKEDVSGVIRRTGIIVGVSASGHTKYVYTPEEPVGMDGLITVGLGEPLEMGDWIKFDVSTEEAQRIFVRKEKGNFTVLDYHKTDPLLPTTVNDNKGSIELLLENFAFSQEHRTVSKKGAHMVRHRELGLIADSERYLDRFRIDSRLDIRIARTRQVMMHNTIWAVISARPHKEGTNTKKPLVQVKRTPLLPTPSIPINNVAPRGNQNDVLDWRKYSNSEDKENIVKSVPNPRNEQFPQRNTRRERRNRQHNASDFDTAGEVKSVGSRSARNEKSKRYRAFVTGISTIKTYLWVCDETNPRRSIMYILGENNTLKLGDWIDGDFKRVYITHEKRVQFVCVEDSWNLIESPVDIDTRRSRDDDGFQMVVVRVNVSYSAEKNCMINKYIGEITDPRYLVPRDIIDREMFTAVITLSRRHNSSLYDWTIERLEPASSPELQCRSEVEKKVKSVMESRVKKERRGKGEEDVVDKMKTLRVKAKNSRDTSNRSARRESYGSRNNALY